MYQKSQPPFGPILPPAEAGGIWQPFREREFVGAFTFVRVA